jgi:hypothetical protein
MNIHHIKEKASQLSEEVSQKTKELKDLLHQLQAACPHAPFHILETPFKAGFIADQMPLRLCSMCGLQDEGWQFKHLGVPYDRKSEIQQVSRDEMFIVRRNVLSTTRVGIDEDDKPA